MAVSRIVGSTVGPNIGLSTSLKDFPLCAAGGLAPEMGAQPRINKILVCSWKVRGSVATTDQLGLVQSELLSNQLLTSGKCFK